MRPLHTEIINICLIGTIIGFESDVYVALEAEGNVLICIQVLNKIDSGHVHEANDSVNLVILSANRTASKIIPIIIITSESRTHMLTAYVHVL